MNTDRFLSIPAEEYHAASRSGQYMSSHLLADFRESPELYRRKTNGEIAESESPALALGRAAHCLILEGRAAFDEQYIVTDGPTNPRTGEPYGRGSRAYAEWLSSQTREIVSPRDLGFIMKLLRSVWTHPTASLLLGEGVAEATVRAEYCGVPCQIRMDWLSPRRGIVDLKTCDSLKWFEGDCKRFGYVHQMAFYRAVLREAVGETVPVHLIAVEKNEPFSTGVWAISDDALDLAEEINGAALERYGKCRRRGEWPTGYEDTRVITSL